MSVGHLFITIRLIETGSLKTIISKIGKLRSGVSLDYKLRYLIGIFKQKYKTIIQRYKKREKLNNTKESERLREKK